MRIKISSKIHLALASTASTRLEDYGRTSHLCLGINRPTFIISAGSRRQGFLLVKSWATFWRKLCVVLAVLINRLIRSTSMLLVWLFVKTTSNSRWVSLDVCLKCWKDYFKKLFIFRSLLWIYIYVVEVILAVAILHQASQIHVELQ